MINWRKSFKQILRKSFVILTALSVIFSSLGPVLTNAPAARAALTGVVATTIGLPNEMLNAPIKASSLPKPIVKIIVTINTISNTLTSAQANFSGTGFATTDLAALAADATSGVALYNDAGSVLGSFDATDVLVPLLSPVWSTNNVILTPVSAPTLNVGDNIYYIVIRTSATPGDTHGIIATIPTNGVITNEGTGPVSPFTTNNYIIDTTAPVLNTAMSGPTDGATGVPISAFMHLGFKNGVSGGSEMLDQSTVNPSNITFKAGAATVPAAIRPFPDGFDIVVSAPPTYAAGSRFAKASAASTGFFMMNGTNPINPQGSYASPSAGDIVYFQHDTFPAEIGLVTNATLTSGIFAVNDFTLFGGQQITKFAAPVVTGLQGSATALTVGDIIVASTTAFPTSDRYNWHIVTAGTAVNDANLRLDKETTVPTFVTSSRISSITPTATATDNGATGGGLLAASQGDLVYLKIGSIYGWHLVTTAGNLSSYAAENTAYIDDGVVNPAIAVNSQMSKIASVAQGPADGTNATPFNFGDMVLAKTTANAANNGAYNFHLVTGSGTGAASSSLRFDNASSPLAVSTAYTINVGVGVKDRAGNPLASPSIINFTTGSTGSANTTPPFIQSSIPQSGNQTFPPNGLIKLTFSVDMKTTGDAAGVNSVTNPANVALNLDNYGAPGAPVSATNTYDSASRTVTITPAANLTVNTGYVVRVLPAAQSVNSAPMANPYFLAFRTASAVDNAAPTVSGVSPANLSIGNSRSGSINIGFSKDMDPSTVSATTVKLEKADDSSVVAGTVTYNPTNRSAVFSPSALLLGSTSYRGRVVAGASGAKSVSAVQLGATTPTDDYTWTFTTDNATDNTGPNVAFSGADNFGVAVTFNEQVKTGGGPSAADNIANYSLESPVGSSISLGGKTVAYDGGTKTAKISGLSLQNSNTYKITVGAAVQDLAGNGILTSGAPAANTSFGTVANSNNTGGQLGPGSGTIDPGMQGMNPTRVTPMNRAAGATSNYKLEFLATTSIPLTGQIVLTFPSGFNVGGADKAVAGAASFCNSDINGPMGDPASPSTLETVSGNSASGTITINTAGAATGANAFICVDLTGIVNSAISSSTGYAVDIKTKDTAANNRSILESKTSAPFFLGSTGSSALTVNVFKDANTNGANNTGEGLNGVTVFLFSPATGGQEATTANNVVDGVATFSNLANGDYMVGIKPNATIDVAFNSAPQPISISGNTTKNFVLSNAAALTISGTVTGSNGTVVDVFASSPNGFTKKTITLTGAAVAYSLPVAANSTYNVGVGPTMPESFMTPGAPPPPPPDFTFMPPANLQVQVAGVSVTGKNFVLTTASKTITGSVVDSGGTGVSGAGIFCRPATSSTGGTVNGFGTGAQTSTAGAFTAKVVEGVYLCGAFKPGMPPVPDKQITVGAASNTPAALTFVLDAGTTSLTISGTVKDDAGNAVSYAGVSGRKVISSADTSALGGNSSNFVGGPTDVNGAYTLYVSTGTWVVEAFAPGFGKLGSKTITVGSASMSGQDFSAQTMSLGTISGQATKATVAQQGVMVRVEGANGGNMTVTDASGNYSIKVPIGVYTVKCMFPGVGESTPLSGVAVTLNTATSGQDCILAAPITITVNLTGGTNKPIADAFVDVRDANGRGNGTNVSVSSGNNATYIVTVPPGTYTVRAGHPAYGTIGSTANISTTQAIIYTATSGQVYAVTGSVTGAAVALSGAWVSLHGSPTGQTNIINLGGQTDGSGNFSINVPNGVYRYRADKPGYKSPAEGIVIVNGAAVNVGAIALTAASRTITGTVTLNSSGISNAFVDATDGAGGFAVAQTNAAGAYSLAIDNGAWILRAHSMGYEGGPLSVVVNNNSPSDQTITLSAISGFTVKPEKQETMTPTSGGFMTNSDIGSGFKLNIPANALGTSSNASTITTQTNTAIPNPSTGTVLSKNAVKISAVDSSGQPIKNLNDGVTITVPYTEADIPAGSSENSLVLGVWNDATQNYDTLSTIIDMTANTLTATTTHFSDFAPLLPGSGAPSTPTGLSATAASASQIDLSWTQTSGATSYDIYRSPTSGGTFARLGSEPTIASGSTTTYSNTGLSASAAYYYKISALNGSGESAASSAVTATTSAVSGSSSGGGGYIPIATAVTGASISIAGGAASATATTVILTLAATNAAQMAIANTVDFAGASWETYAVSKSWTLTAGDGIKTVYAKFRDAAGVASSAVFDTITLGNVPDAIATPNPVSSFLTSYPDGALLKSPDAPEVYVIKDGNKVWVKTAEEFVAAGYKWEDIKVVSGEVLKAVGLARLIKVAGDPRVYALRNNKKQHIKSAEEFISAGYKWENIILVSEAEINSYAEEGVFSGKTIIVIPAWLRVRALNTVKSAELGRVNKNEKYSVLDEKDGWYKIQTSNGVIGWVSGAYATASAENASVSEGAIAITIVPQYLRIRSMNSLDGKILGLVKKGETYSVLEENNGWYKIKTSQGATGWILGDYAVKK